MKFLLIAVALLLASCGKSLVDETYGTLSRESINGFDLMKEHLESRYDVSISSYIDPSRRAEYDLVIYLQSGLSPVDWMHALDRDIASSLRPVGVAEPDDEEGFEVESEPEQETDPVAPEESVGIQGSLHDEDPAVAVLIFQRGSTASLAFWSRQWKALSAANQRAKDYTAARILYEELPDLLPESSFFFRREISERRPYEKRIYYRPADRGAFQGNLPGRIPAELKIVREDAEHVSAVFMRSIISMDQGTFFAEGTVPGAHLFIVADTAPFLNYHLMRKENLVLLDFILHRAMKYRTIDTSRKPKIMILDRWLTMEQKAEEEQSLFAIFFRPPWNLSAALLLILFVIFIWSRLMRDRPVTEVEPESHEGDLIRHFEGVGHRLAAIAHRSSRKKR